MAKKEARVTRMVMVMAASFAFVWTPYALSAVAVLIEAAVGGSGEDPLMDSPLAVAPILFAKTSTFLNPFIYVGLNRQVRPGEGKLSLSDGKIGQGNGNGEWEFAFALSRGTAFGR